MTNNQPLLLLFDADMIAFEMCSSVEQEINWGDDFWTLHADAADAKAGIDNRVSSLTETILKLLKHKGAYEILMCFSDDNNFRKKILPTYKANRIGKRKPVCYKGIKEWMMEEFTTYLRPDLEADDCIGILATSKPNTVIISGDKDFCSVPGRFYNYRKGEMYEISQEDADRWHMYQTLVGDTADNYPGCPGIGAKTAEKLLDADCSWDAVVAQFVKKGLTEEDALIQAQVARILRKEDYDFKSKEAILWKSMK